MESAGARREQRLRSAKAADDGARKRREQTREARGSFLAGKPLVLGRPRGSLSAAWPFPSWGKPSSWNDCPLPPPGRGNVGRPVASEPRRPPGQQGERPKGVSRQVSSRLGGFAGRVRSARLRSKGEQSRRSTLTPPAAPPCAGLTIEDGCGKKTRHFNVV
jgi:hypothetical protein